MSSDFKEYRVQAHAFDVVHVKARSEYEALKKAKTKIKLKAGYTVESRQQCTTQGCPNLVRFPIGGHHDNYCDSCRHDTEERRINSPA